MVVTKSILFGILNIGLLIFREAHGSVAMNVDTSCVPRNCSQPPLKAGLPSFPCYIGHRKECDAAEAWFSDHITNVGYYSFTYLANIGTYMYIDRTNPKRVPNPSLNFTIKTPYGGQESVTTRAVRVDFDSPPGYGEDSFYSKNPRCRLIDFRNATRQTFDISHPREVNYACLVGLMIRNEVTYHYRLRLKSLPSFALNEYFLVVHSEPRKMQKYKIVLATAVIPMHKSLHVVWEQPPLDFYIDSYNVTLSTREGHLKSKIIKYGQQDFEFKNLKPDVFIVKVEPKTKNGSSPCFFTESKPIRLVYTIEDNPPEFSMLNTALAVVGGTVLGAMLLIVLIICWKKRYPSIPRQPQRILIGADNDSNLVHEVETVIKKKMRVHVKVADATTGIPLERLIRSGSQNTVILVICSKNAAEVINKCHLPNYSNDYFCRAMTFLQANALPCKTYIACVHAESNCPHIHLNLNQHLKQRSYWKPLNLIKKRKEDKVYNLLSDFDQLGKKFGNGFVEDDYDSSIEWLNLQKAIDGCQRQRGQEVRESLESLQSSQGSFSSINNFIAVRRSKKCIAISSESVIDEAMDNFIAIQHKTCKEETEEESNEQLERHKFASCNTLLSKDIEVPLQQTQETLPNLRTSRAPQSLSPQGTPGAFQSLSPQGTAGDLQTHSPFMTPGAPQSVSPHGTPVALQSLPSHNVSEFPEHDEFSSHCSPSPSTESEMNHYLPRLLIQPSDHPSANYHGNWLQEHPESHLCQKHNKFEKLQQRYQHRDQDKCHCHNINEKPLQQYGFQHNPPPFQQSVPPQDHSQTDHEHFESGFISGNLTYHYRPEDTDYGSRCEKCQKQNYTLSEQESNSSNFSRQNPYYLNFSRKNPNYSNPSRKDLITSRHGSNHGSTSSPSPQMQYMRGKYPFYEDELGVDQPLFSNDTSFKNTNYICPLDDKTSQRTPLLSRKDPCESSPEPVDTVFLPPDSPDNLSCTEDFFIEADESGEAHIASKSFKYDLLPIAVEDDVACDDLTLERANSDPETCEILTNLVGRNENDSDFQQDQKHLGQIQDAEYQEKVTADPEDTLVRKISARDNYDSGMFSMK